MKLFRGVIEDNNDPLESGRVRVRIFGLHNANNENSPESFDTIAFDDLPWAEIVGGLEFSLVGGVGLSSVPKQGAWVWVTLENDNPNKPIVVGTIIGTSKTRQKYLDGEGFNDKDGVYPFDTRTEETDINRLSTGKKLADPHTDDTRSIYASSDTIHKQINDNLDVKTGITDAVSGADVSQSEPSSLNDLSTYPNCTVLETSSGHTVELDDTVGNERIRVYHTSGSYMEMKPDGSCVTKNMGTSQYIHMSDVQEHVTNGVKRYIEQNLEEIIDAAVMRKIGANFDEHVVGNSTSTVNGGTKDNTDMDVFKTIGGFFKITATGNLEIIGDLKVTGNLEVTDAGAFGKNVVSSAEITDSSGNLSSLRDAYDAHTHIGNMGIPTAIPTSVDPKTKAIAFSWSSSPKGFK